ncbi:Hypothetical protein NTJ_14269 [Nesidiocoris tenuis]|uniref:Cystatin domain-containing protein n=1 Tax=Nesidiocoris tenuis TaxID=355587 RepID=A0ABN7BAR6_9HEMI|nr:Hypothetical protein NTJ_14269 [Nesidiocoris tenuis]
MTSSWGKAIVILAALALMTLLVSAKRMEDYDEDTQDAIYAAVDRVNMMLNSNEIMGVYIVNGAERETLKDGISYRFDLILRETDCVKRGGRWHIRECQILDEPESRDLSCVSELISSKHGHRRITNVDCRNVQNCDVPANPSRRNEDDLKKFIKSLTRHEERRI